MVVSWLGHLGTLIAVLVIAWSCLKTAEIAQPTGRLTILLQMVTYYARYWFIWLLIWANVQLLYDNQTIYWLLIGLSLLYLYISWVEPNRLRVSRYQINLTVPSLKQSSNNLPTDLSANVTTDVAANVPAKIAVLSDIHIGIFSSKHQLERLVKCINKLDVDVVIFLGDWLYYPTKHLLERLHILKSINKPCYTVLSEADTQPISIETLNNIDLNSQQLSEVLPSLGIHLVPEQGLTVANVKLLGIHDNQAIDLPKTIDQQTKARHPVVIVTHDIRQLEANPRNLSDAQHNTLIIAGQTHGGQVNIPIVTPLMVHALTGNKLAAGLRKPKVSKNLDTANQPNRHYQVWVNTGIGMTGLPFRFNCPPTIDVLTISIKNVNT